LPHPRNYKVGLGTEPFFKLQAPILGLCRVSKYLYYQTN